MKISLISQHIIDNITFKLSKPTPRIFADAAEIVIKTKTKTLGRRTTHTYTEMLARDFFSKWAQKQKKGIWFFQIRNLSSIRRELLLPPDDEWSGYTRGISWKTRKTSTRIGKKKIVLLFIVFLFLLHFCVFVPRCKKKKKQELVQNIHAPKKKRKNAQWEQIKRQKLF